MFAHTINEFFLPPPKLFLVAYYAEGEQWTADAYKTSTDIGDANIITPVNKIPQPEIPQCMLEQSSQQDRLTCVTFISDLGPTTFPHVHRNMVLTHES